MKKIIVSLVVMFSLVSTANAIDSEPILKGSFVAIDSEPILKIDYVSIDSEPILRDSPKAIDSEPILREELTEMSMIYKKDGRYIKVTYKAVKAEEVKSKDGNKMEKQGRVQKVGTRKKSSKDKN